MGWVLWPSGVGWKDRARTVRTGAFACRNPNCKGKRDSELQQYRLQEHRNWIVALYIPVIPLNLRGMSVQCASCKTRYSLDALSADELSGVAASVAVPLGAGATRMCPHCQQLMSRDGRTCPQCNEDSPPWTLHEGNWWYRSKEGFWQLYRERSDEWVRLPDEYESVEDAATSKVALETMRANGRPHSDTLRDCPHCEEQMRRVAETCPHCHQDSPAWKFHEGAWWSKTGDDWYFWGGRRGWVKYEGEAASTAGPSTNEPSAASAAVKQSETGS